MITGNIKSHIDQIWNAFWFDGISNPLEVIEQITYLLFLRRLDDLHTLEENKSARLKRPMERRVFPEGNDGIGKNGGRPYEDLRWSRFKHFAPGDICAAIGEHVPIAGCRWSFLVAFGTASTSRCRSARRSLPADRRLRARR